MNTRFNEHTHINMHIRIFKCVEFEDDPCKWYPVEVILDGEQHFNGQIPREDLPLLPGDDLEEDGQRLFSALFGSGELRDAWTAAKDRHDASNKPLRIQLQIEENAKELRGLQWELMRNDSAMVSADANTPFSRYIPIKLPWGAMVEQRPLRVLVAISNPTDLQTEYDLEPIREQEERENLEHNFAEAGADIEYEFMDPPITRERLVECLQDGYHVLYFLGHGQISQKTGISALLFQQEDGTTDHFKDHELITMLTQLKIRPHLICLGACHSGQQSSLNAFSGLAPKLVSIGVPAVIAMQDSVTVNTMHLFGATFFRQLLAHGSVDIAVNEARNALIATQKHDASVPILFMRLRSGQLWSNEVDARGIVIGSEHPQVFWNGLRRYIKSGRCIPILGPSLHNKWLPDRTEIATALAEKNEYPFSKKYELPRVAQYLARYMEPEMIAQDVLDVMLDHFTDHYPIDFRPHQDQSQVTLAEAIRAVGWSTLVADDPNNIFQVLARLRLPIYLTSTYDNMMFEALAAEPNVEPVREICRWTTEMRDPNVAPFFKEDDPDYEPHPEEPLVYHMFGSDQAPESLMISEDKFLDFLVHASAKNHLEHITAAMNDKLWLFLGYNLDDWEFRVIMRGLIAANRWKRTAAPHIGVQIEVDRGGTADEEKIRDFLQVYFSEPRVTIYRGTAQQFAAELRENMEEHN